MAHGIKTAAEDVFRHKFHTGNHPTKGQFKAPEGPEILTFGETSNIHLDEGTEQKPITFGVVVVPDWDTLYVYKQEHDTWLQFYYADMTEMVGCACRAVNMRHVIANMRHVIATHMMTARI